MTEVLEAADCQPIVFKGVRLGLPICEDIWFDNVTDCLAESGAEILLVPNGSPFEIDKMDVRMNIAVARQRETNLPMIYVNQVGGQDELVFDGGSFVLDRGQQIKCQMPMFRGSHTPPSNGSSGTWVWIP